MNNDEFQSALVALNHIAQQVQSIQQEVAQDAAREKVTQLLSGLDLELRVVRSMIGKAMGLTLCEHCWPNEIMQPEFGGLLRCPGCGVVANERLSREPVSLLRPFLWHEEADADVPFAHSRQ